MDLIQTLYNSQAVKLQIMLGKYLPQILHSLKIII